MDSLYLIAKCYYDFDITLELLWSRLFSKKLIHLIYDIQGEMKIEIIMCPFQMYSA